MKLREEDMRWDLLGLMRYLLASIVAISHLKWYLAGAQPIYRVAEFSGLVAVLGFLLISGYSIAASYEREPQGYFFRRFLRIVPLYVFLRHDQCSHPGIFSNWLTDSSRKSICGAEFI
jgi:peptidoglycan/LPS O-acetylase OafA/YrhL